ncbi:MAG: ABC transporter substrate-binding protein [Burkholderiales bacterium]
MANENNERESPCVNLCKLDPLTQQCVGCYRTIEEIAGWTNYSDEEKAAVLNALPARRAAFDGASLKNDPYPQRIVCLTEEPTEVLYAIGEEHRIIGISGFTVRPTRARKEKPKVSAFTSAKVEEIVALDPDLAIGFSDIQADIAQALVKRGVEVWISNHRSVEGILAYVHRLGALVGASEKTERYARELEVHVAHVRELALRLPRRPRVYFEEWDEPQISCIRWVSELIGIAGGEDVFPERAQASLARDRILADPQEVVRRQPDIIIGSWCGKKFRPERVANRPGWDAISAVRDGEVHEIKSSIILQPGPAALTDGLDALHAIISQWAMRPSETGRER